MSDDIEEFSKVIGTLYGADVVVRGDDARRVVKCANKLSEVLDELFTQNIQSEAELEQEVEEFMNRK